MLLQILSNGTDKLNRKYSSDDIKLNFSKEVYGQLGTPDDPTKINLNFVSHMFTDFIIDEELNVWGQLKVLDTPQGKTLQEIIKNDLPITTLITGVGLVTDNIISDYKLGSINFITQKEQNDCAQMENLSEY